MVDHTQFFNIQDLLINEIFGSVWLFIFAGIIFVAWISNKASFNWQITIMFEILFLSIVFSTLLNQTIFGLVILIVSSIFYFILSQKLRRG